MYMQMCLTIEDWMKEFEDTPEHQKLCQKLVHSIHSKGITYETMHFPVSTTPLVHYVYSNHLYYYYYSPLIV